MKDRKTFFIGLAAGAVMTVMLGVILNSAFSIYKVYGIGQMEFSKKVEALYDILDQYYVDDYDKEELLEYMYAGLVSGLGDPYSVYMDAGTLTRFMEDTEGTYSGIGVIISIDKADNTVVALAAFEDSPGERAGILPGDKFIKINDTDITGDDFDLVPKMTKGVKGTKVNVTIYRPSDDTTFSVDIIRDDIIQKTVTHKMLENNVGYIRIIQFERVTYNQFVEAYNDLTRSGMKGLVIDLRNNPGGLLDVVWNMTDLLVPEGIVLYTEDKNGNREDYKTDANHIGIPLALLVNGNSASASEVMSGAVKDHGVGVLVGSQTFGKGLVQNLYTLKDGSGVKVTIAKYYTPSGVCVNGDGITPDFIVEMSQEKADSFSTLSFEEDTQLQVAFEIVSDMIK